MNIGFDPEEIAQFKKELEEEGKNYIAVEDEEGLAETQEFVHFQFLGKHEDKEVIYDTLLTTLEFEYETQLFEMALERLAKQLDMKEEDIDPEKYEEEIYEIMDEIEEEDELKVSESICEDHDFEYGIGLEAQINVPVLDEAAINNFIERYNSGSLELDSTLYSFAQRGEDNED